MFLHQFRNMRIWLMLLLIGYLSNSLSAQQLSLIEPPFWWVGMKNTELQLLVYGKDISLSRPLINYPGVRLKETLLVESPNYLFLNLEISPEAKAGSFEIKFQLPKNKSISYGYQLLDRTEGSADRASFGSKDVIYLLMPDRFANGDPTNDNVAGMIEQSNRNNPNGRHGGDLKGIANHLDYFADLGVTALWLNPVFEGNVPTPSYHGYSITNFYRIDPRFGSNDDFKLLVDKAHAKGLKVIKDMVFNHFGTGHWWMNDLPMKDWINQWPEYTRSNFRSGTLMDPHAAEADREKMLNGWFDKMMADLNQTNPLVAKYLIQNSIWWVEFAGLDGIRMDTYPYSEKNFMAHWMQQLRSEYPNFSVVGEVWLNSSQQVAYWHENNRNLDGYNSNLNYVFDFPLKYAIGSAFNEGNGWSSGASKLYETLSFDFLYDDPQKIINFADNHDGDRIFSTLGKDLRKLKMAMIFLMTTRGAPQIYYGTEILMTGWEHDGHGFIREDFPGGWEGDAVNAFTDEGLSADQKDAKAFMKLLMNWRKQSKAVTEGKLKHYIREEGVYVYFRYTDDEAVMVVINNNEESRTFKTNRFAENLQTYTTGTDILHRTYFDQLKMISVPAMSARIIELKK